jgi:hypothetical protein
MTDHSELIARLHRWKHDVPTTRERAEMIEDMRDAAAALEQAVPPREPDESMTLASPTTKFGGKWTPDVMRRLWIAMYDDWAARHAAPQQERDTLTVEDSAGTHHLTSAGQSMMDRALRRSVTVKQQERDTPPAVTAQDWEKVRDAVELSRQVGESNEQIRATLDAVQGRDTRAWVDVRDRLPVAHGLVVVVYAHGAALTDVWPARWNAVNQTFGAGGGWFELDEITHWMPLPPKPDAAMGKR